MSYSSSALTLLLFLTCACSCRLHFEDCAFSYFVSASPVQSTQTGSGEESRGYTSSASNLQKAPALMLCAILTLVFFLSVKTLRTLADLLHSSVRFTSALCLQFIVILVTIVVNFVAASSNFNCTKSNISQHSFTHCKHLSSASTSHIRQHAKGRSSEQVSAAR